MKATNTLLLLAGGGLFVYLFAHRKHPQGLLLGEDTIESVHIDAWTENGYPIEIVWSRGIATKELYNRDETAGIIEKAKQEGARISGDATVMQVFADNLPAQKSIVSLRYRDLGNDMYYVKIAFYDGTKKEGKMHKDYFELYLRNAKYDNATVETF